MSQKLDAFQGEMLLLGKAIPKPVTTYHGWNLYRLGWEWYAAERDGEGLFSRPLPSMCLREIERRKASHA